MARYLLVDDSQTIRLGLASAIKTVQKGATIVEAANPAQALKLFKEGAFDAVFLDLILDDAGDGLQLLDQFLRLRPDAIVIITTGQERSNPDVVKGISQGAFGHLVKPVRLPEVSRLLAEVEEEMQRRSENQ